MRRKHTCWLIENQKFGFRHQQFDDFDLLPLTDRKLTDQRVRIDVEPVSLGKFAHLRFDRRKGQHERQMLKRQGDIFDNRKRRHEHEVLKHHANAMFAPLLGERIWISLSRMLIVPASGW